MKPGKAELTVSGSKLTLEAAAIQEKMIEHIGNNDVHISASEKERFKALETSFSNHDNNGNVHVSEDQINEWSSKETTKGAQDKANKIKALLNMHQNNCDVHISSKEKANFEDKYTRSEINSLLTYAISGINWVEEVESYDQLNTVHPNPAVKDTCTVLDTGLSYTYNGKEWVVSFVSFIGVATPVQDGKMSKDDKLKLDNIEEGANNYIHPDDEYSRHVSDDQISSWTNKADDVEATSVSRGLMSPIDKKKMDSVEHNANHYIHPSMHNFAMIETDEDHQWVSSVEKLYYNAKVDPDTLAEEINNVIEETKRYINNTIANLSNSTPELYDLLVNIRKELSADAVGVLLKEIAGKLETKAFEAHENDKNIHVSSDLMKMINQLLEDPKSDWNETNVDSPKFIKNKPDSLPAKGGDSDTVGGFKPSVLFSNRKAATITIGTLKANCLERSVDFICDGTNDTEVIQNAFNSLSSFGGKILFREGTYEITEPLTLKGNHITIDSCNATLHKSFSEGTLLDILGDDCVLENITFTHDTYPKNDNLFVNISGSRNTIRFNHFKNGSGIKLGSGSYNRITDNMIVDPYCGICVDPNKANSTNTCISNNTITGGQHGIIFKANSWSIIYNFIKNNEILNCGIGIQLTSSVPMNDKVTSCGITGNTILRGYGDDSAYGTNQKDIVIEYGFKNVISNNTLKKVEIRGSKNQNTNNIIL